MQTDEVHWVFRAELLHQRLNRHSLNFSSHLGHPGVAPAFVLMAGQVIANKYNKGVEIVTGTPGEASPLTGARLGNALFSSLLPCIVFLFLLNWTGKGEAFCVGALLALGPRTIDLSQIAHIDTIFSVVVTLTVIAYLSALRSRRLGLKLIAGMLFGLCLLCKPTCLALIPAFMLAKIILRWCWPDTFKEGPLAWSDVWVLLTGLSVFALGYTRIWHHRKNFPQWEGLDRTIPEALYSLGVTLRGGLVGAILTTIVVVVAIRIIAKARAHAPLSWVEQTLALLGFITTCWLVTPQVFENLALYFTRVFALPSVQHVSFKGVAPAIPGGYLTLASVDLPPLVLISIFLMPLLFIPPIRKRLSPSEQQLWVMAAIIAVMWILFLSTSSKQAWRYALPVAPQLYIIACISLCAIGRSIDAPRVPLILLLLGQVKAVYRGYPHWDLYQSPFAPPPRIAMQLGIFHPRTGQLEAVSYLISEAKARGRELRVTLVGDGKVLSREASRWFGSDAHWVRFGYYREDKADFLLIQGNIRFDDLAFNKYLAYQPTFQSRVKDVPVARVYTVSRPGSEGPALTPTSSTQLTNLEHRDSEEEERESADAQSP